MIKDLSNESYSKMHSITAVSMNLDKQAGGYSRLDIAKALATTSKQLMQACKCLEEQ